MATGHNPIAGLDAILRPVIEDWVNRSLEPFVAGLFKVDGQELIDPRFLIEARAHALENIGEETPRRGADLRAKLKGGN